MTININEGDSFVKGRSRETAQELLERAEALGIDLSLVRTTSHGYIVPTALVEAVEEDETSETTVEEKKDVTGDPEGENKAEEVVLFDPNDHTIPEVSEYIAAADDDEVARVLKLEAEGKNRVAFRTENNTEEGAK